MNSRFTGEYGNIRKLMKYLAIIGCSMMLAATLSSCAEQPSESESAEQTITASEYMVKLNQAAETLRESLDGFASAIDDGDISTLQSKADDALHSMDALDDLKTPDELSDVKSQYEDAIDAFHTSLNDYISVYTEIMSSPDTEKIDKSKYAERFETIQKEYDNGMNLLEKADSAAKEL